MLAAKRTREYNRIAAGHNTKSSLQWIRLASKTDEFFSLAVRRSAFRRLETAAFRWLAD